MQHGGDLTAALGKRAAKRAAAAVTASQKASAQAGSTTPSKNGKPSAVPSVFKPSPSCLGKGKFGRRNKHQLKLLRRQPSSSSPPSGTGTSITRIPAPFLVPASSDGSGGWPRPVLGLESRQFEVALSGAGIMKDSNRRERTAEKEKEKKRDVAKNGASSSKTEGRSMKKQDNARARGWPAAARRPDVLSASTNLLCEFKHPQPCASQQGPPADDTAPYSRSMLTRHIHQSRPWGQGGRRGKGRNRRSTSAYGFARQAPPPSSRRAVKNTSFL